MGLAFGIGAKGGLGDAISNLNEEQFQVYDKITKQIKGQHDAAVKEAELARKEYTQNAVNAANATTSKETKEDDSKNEERVSSEKQVGEESVETKPVEEKGKEKTGDSGVVQEEQVDPYEQFNKQKKTRKVWNIEFQSDDIVNNLTIEENGDFVEFDLLSNKSTILLTQNFSSLLNKFSTGPDIFSIGRQAGIIGADVSSPFIGYSNNNHAKVDTFVIDTRKLVGISYASPIDVLSGEDLAIQIVAQSNITGVVLNWKLYRLDPDDLGNGGTSGTTLSQITGAGNLNLNADFTSSGISTYGKEIIYDITLGGSSIINKGDLLFLGWSYDSISVGSSDFLNISATIRS